MFLGRKVDIKLRYVCIITCSCAERADKELRYTSSRVRVQEKLKKCGTSISSRVRVQEKLIKSYAMYI